jgi:hypothetical protein
MGNELIETRNSDDTTSYTGPDGKFRRGNPGRSLAQVGLIDRFRTQSDNGTGALPVPHLFRQTTGPPQWHAAGMFVGTMPVLIENKA